MTENDVINIVAHSQGTIITMLANMLVKQAGGEPANCVILNHSPYSLENRFSENLQEGHHQTDAARQNREVPNLQWDMPKPLDEKELKLQEDK